MSPRERVGGFLRRVARRRTLPYLLAGGLLLAALVVIGSEVERNLSSIEQWIENLGPWGIVAFILLIAVATSCFIPDSLLCMVAGALYGMGWGLCAAIAGMFLASMLQYVLAHRLLRPRIQGILDQRPSLQAIQRAVRRDELRLQILVRLTPLNPATASYLFGAVGVRLSGYLIACLALIPALALEVYAGHAGRHMAQAATGSDSSSRLHQIATFVGLALCVIVFVVISRLARNAVAQAVAETEAQNNPAGADGSHIAAPSKPI